MLSFGECLRLGDFSFTHQAFSHCFSVKGEWGGGESYNYSAEQGFFQSIVLSTIPHCSQFWHGSLNSRLEMAPRRKQLLLSPLLQSICFSLEFSSFSFFMSTTLLYLHRRVFFLFYFVFFSCCYHWKKVFLFFYILTGSRSIPGGGKNEGKVQNSLFKKTKPTKNTSILNLLYY